MNQRQRWLRTDVNRLEIIPHVLLDLSDRTGMRAPDGRSTLPARDDQTVKALIRPARLAPFVRRIKQRGYALNFRAVEKVRKQIEHFRFLVRPEDCACIWRQ